MRAFYARFYKIFFPSLVQCFFDCGYACTFRLSVVGVVQINSYVNKLRVGILVLSCLLENSVSLKINLSYHDHDYQEK